MRKLIGLLVIIATAATIVVAVAIAGGTGPKAPSVADGLVWVDGNPTCGDQGHALGFKVEPVANGTYDANGNLTNDPTKGIITISNFNGKSFNWAFTPLGVATYEIAVVIVKGGSEANVYTYTNIFTNSDTGLHTPLNPNGNTMNGTKVYGFSHVDFCFDPKDD